MIIISRQILKEFIQIHPEAKTSVDRWFNLTRDADWSSFESMRSTFNSVDAVGNDRYVFNIGGINWRLVALIIFKVRTLFILFIGSHADYDRIDASTITFKK